MEQTEHPLLSLSSEKQQQIVDLVDNGNIGEIADKGGMTRRQVLQVAVALGAGATVGGYSVDQIIGEARAAADTSDSDGNVGLPSDPVDVFAEGIDANSVGSASNRVTDIYGDSADLNSVSIGGAEIGFVLEQVKTVSASGSGTVTLNIDFSSLSEGQYLVAVESDPNFRGPVTATTNYGGAGDYYYYDETGTKQSPVDNWQLLDISDPTRGRLDISITDRIRTSFDLSREINRNLSGFAQLGGMTASGSLDTLTIEFANADSDAYEATLYRRVQL